MKWYDKINLRDMVTCVLTLLGWSYIVIFIPGVHRCTLRGGVHPQLLETVMANRLDIDQHEGWFDSKPTIITTMNSEWWKPRFVCSGSTPNVASAMEFQQILIINKEITPISNCLPFWHLGRFFFGKAVSVRFSFRSCHGTLSDVVNYLINWI